MGDLPLRTPTDRRPGGPLPRRQANRTHPHPIAMNLCFESDVLLEEHRVLIRLSPGYPLLRARLDTRYSPVRRSPATCASTDPAAPRLACVKPVASVHPEPGSNSSLYKLYLRRIPGGKTARHGQCLCLRTTIQYSRIKRFVYSTQVPIKSTRFLYYFCLCNPFKELLNAFRP